MKKLYRSNNKINHILVLDGDFPEIVLLKDMDSDIYATDGAANILLDNGYIPEAIIGDMDSIDESLIKKHRYPSRKMIEIPDQNSNDFEKALRFIQSRGVKYLTVFGFTGGQLEHTLNNWSVLAKYANVINMQVINSDRSCMMIDNSIILSTEPNEKISIIPFGEAQLSTKGLKWDLDREYLILGIREGASNIAMGEEVEINLIKGKVLLFKDYCFPSFYKEG